MEKGRKGREAPPLEEGEGEGNRADEDSAHDDDGAGAASRVAVHGSGGSGGLGLFSAGGWRERDVLVVYRHRVGRPKKREKWGTRMRGTASAAFAPAIFCGIKDRGIHGAEDAMRSGRNDCVPRRRASLDVLLLCDLTFA